MNDPFHWHSPIEKPRSNHLRGSLDEQKLYVSTALTQEKSFQLKKVPTPWAVLFENDIRLQDESVSRQHLRIEKAAERYF